MQLTSRLRFYGKKIACILIVFFSLSLGLDIIQDLSHKLETQYLSIWTKSEFNKEAKPVNLLSVSNDDEYNNLSDSFIVLFKNIGLKTILLFILIYSVEIKINPLFFGKYIYQCLPFYLFNKILRI
jgi:hypothetical protein